MRVIAATHRPVTEEDVDGAAARRACGWTWLHGWGQNR